MAIHKVGVLKQFYLLEWLSSWFLGKAMTWQCRRKCSRCSLFSNKNAHFISTII
ncbi:hypothetical protein BRADI_4g04531v3 [Brachypodium distachyon]|uniref:Uncharacterized protein n=1 Tax=Brachypodium distachyon TaxID=15368 RepID=A0A0Q3HDN1_BRADI|nr:hypothetical protein BRADI_4g04531v3 [Brachypodium distachyon]